MDQRNEFGVYELEILQDRKSIKIEFSIAYSLKMNGIVKRKNSLIITKAWCLLLNSNTDPSFWPKIFDILVYLFNKTFSSTLDHNISLKKFLKVYYNNYQYSYIQNLSDLRT